MNTKNSKKSKKLWVTLVIAGLTLGFPLTGFADDSSDQNVVQTWQTLQQARQQLLQYEHKLHQDSFAGSDLSSDLQTIQNQNQAIKNDLEAYNHAAQNNPRFNNSNPYSSWNSFQGTAPVDRFSGYGKQDGYWKDKGIHGDRDGHDSHFWHRHYGRGNNSGINDYHHVQ